MVLGAGGITTYKIDKNPTFVVLRFEEFSFLTSHEK